jgi:branched-chain amino acid transport system substrate-binding protein
MAGRPVELIVEDYEFKAAVGLTKARKLVERDRVHSVTGVILSAAALAIKDYVHAQGVPFIISGAAVAELLMMEKPSPYVFRTSFGASQVPSPPAKFVYEKLAARTATVIAGDTVGTIELVMGFARAFEEAGGKVVQELYPPIGTTDFGPYIAKIRRDVDVVATLVPGADGIRFISLLPASGPAALGMYASQAYVHTIDSPRNRRFVRAFRAKYGRHAGGSAEYSDVALAAIHQALRATGGPSRTGPGFWRRCGRWTWRHPAGGSGSTAIKTSSPTSPSPGWTRWGAGSCRWWSRPCGGWIDSWGWLPKRI